MYFYDKKNINKSNKILQVLYFKILSKWKKRQQSLGYQALFERDTATKLFLCLFGTLGKYKMFR